MPGPTTPAPPMVVDHADMMAFAKDVEDSILVTMDFEGVDHLQAAKGQPQPSNYVKMSEVGIAVFDPRDKSANTNQIRIDDLGAQIRARHTIIEMYRRYTEETCTAFYHRGAYRNPSKAHHARPYHCKFARSIFRTAEEAMRDIKQLIGELVHQNRTTAEVQNGVERQICVLFWAAGMEEDILREGGIDLVGMSSRIKVWDMQIWSVFQIRFTKKQTKGEEAFGSLGALGDGSKLHNATNDAVAQMLALLKLLTLTEEEWSTWHVDRRDLPSISMDWVNTTIYEDNFSSRPKALRDFSRNPSTQNTSKHNGNKNPRGYSKGKSSHHRGTSNYAAQTPSVPAVRGSVASYVKDNTSTNSSIGGSETDQWWTAYEARQSIGRISSAKEVSKKPTAAVASSSEEVGTGWPAEMEWDM
ncbi:hypothetical protein GE21DRAFT_5342 [Neurospora crassa]|uniref:Gfd2/YDR514C-like C-terminal domain-containing protein n=1 Tax=Neurospora crassa (strain ATCC 24698 / 74-OR23-1A / CBS 708.71 / DSM 1257 / FGSC 987) TaxID=367110 RepID=Q7S1E1_NEUCR|nr:hypothetical protein NCU04894 [Neurospora crassa OR74A]EAA29167.1 hypothetical protein NCU04894 [Neurospora crassa OR74A]KHE78847.1 hypothetical protein GE21DRAFT_5342 [Neurospora crassa]|eukprot:XP_958403.1 hypothetical protein NCU04894 [Neurospora crassa OR74A]